jgi:superfamily I DNA and/or RNA helicase
MNKILKSGTIKFDTVIIDEAAKANLAESVLPMMLGERFILVGDDKQLPPYSDTNAIEEYSKERTTGISNEEEILNALSISLFQKLHETFTHIFSLSLA